MLLGHFKNRHFINRHFIFNKSRIGHFIDKTFYLQDISQTRNLYIQDISQTSHFIDRVELFITVHFHRQSRFFIDILCQRQKSIFSETTCIKLLAWESRVAKVTQSYSRRLPALGFKLRFQLFIKTTYSCRYSFIACNSWYAQYSLPELTVCLLKINANRGALFIFFKT